MIDALYAAGGPEKDGRVSLSAKTLRMQKSMRVLGCAKMPPIPPTLAASRGRASLLAQLGRVGPGVCHGARARFGSSYLPQAANPS